MADEPLRRPDEAVGSGWEPPSPVDWDVLTAEEAAVEWAKLDRWVYWLRRTYGLPASVVPPLWHRHPELVWELSALHLHWLASYERAQSASAPLGWHQDFAVTRRRLRDWVAASATRLDRDRPTRQSVWPGEPAADPVLECTITNRRHDFEQFVEADLRRRRAAAARSDGRMGPPERRLPSWDDPGR